MIIIITAITITQLICIMIIITTAVPSIHSRSHIAIHTRLRDLKRERHKTPDFKLLTPNVHNELMLAALACNQVCYSLHTHTHTHTHKHTHTHTHTHI